MSDSPKPEFDRELRDAIIAMRSDVEHIRELLDDFKKRIGDHESRLRCLEANKNQLVGKGAAIGFIILVTLEVLSLIRSGG